MSSGISGTCTNYASSACSPLGNEIGIVHPLSSDKTCELVFPSSESLACNTPNNGNNSKTERGIFVSEEWREFLDLNKIPIQAGVPPDSLVKLANKELVDNALDESINVTWDFIHDGDDECPTGFYVQDDGAGLCGNTPEEISQFFSLSRPYMSSKKILLPTRGALGNGLRVVSGIASASGGFIVVLTKGHRIKIVIDESTGIAHPADIQLIETTGTRIEVYLGTGIKSHTIRAAGTWGDLAIFLAGKGQTYKGKTSPYWYDSGSFYSLCKSVSNGVTVRQFISGDRVGYDGFEGCTGRKSGQIAEPFKNVLVRDLSKDQTDDLLSRMRQNSTPVKPVRLGELGSDAYDTWNGRSYSYVKTMGQFNIQSTGRHSSNIPYVIEAWASEDMFESLQVTVNGTPITGTVSLSYSEEEKCVRVFGCELCELGYVKKIRKINHPVSVFVNITTPYMPITSAGKSPDLSKMRCTIFGAIEKVSKRAIRTGKSIEPRSDENSIRDVVFDHIPEAAEKSGGGLPFSQRQMFYVIRPYVQDLTGKDLGNNYFSQIVTDYENLNGEISGMYRDPRGVLYHPHMREDIPLGTQAISKYKRPEWTFNKILFIEKEGLIQALKQTRWAERNDCALITSKGQATRALKDVIDLLADDDEPITVFCVHDADAAGTMIYQSLQEETRSRGRRKIEIINLGLELWDAIESGLEVENVEHETRQPVAKYVSEKGGGWEEKLQTHRVELNAMNSRQFVEWLDTQFAPFSGKLIPPQKILDETLRKRLESDVTDLVRERILRENQERIKEEAVEILEILKPNMDRAAVSAENVVSNHLQINQEESWRDAVNSIVDGMVEEYYLNKSAVS